MNLIESLRSQLDAEVERTRRVLANTPQGHDDWKPHEKSMPFGRLAMLVAQMPSWVSLVIDRDDLDLSPAAGGSNVSQKPLRTSAELLKALDDGAAQGRKSLSGTSEAHLMKPWRLLMKGKVVSEQPRHVVLRDTFSHLAHHRGQFTVYLRMNGAPVASTYGPSADDTHFG